MHLPIAEVRARVQLELFSVQSECALVHVIPHSASSRHERDLGRRPAEVECANSLNRVELAAFVHRKQRGLECALEVVRLGVERVAVEGDASEKTNSVLTVLHST